MTYTEPENVKIEEIDIEEISEIIGFNEDESTGFSSPLIEEEQEEELDSKITQHGFALNPLTKLVVVGGGMLIAITILGLVWNGMQKGNNYTAVKQNEPKELPEKSLLTPEEQELAELKAQMALNKQKEDLKKLKIKSEEKPELSPPESKTVTTQPPKPELPPPRKQTVQPTTTRAKKPLPPKKRQVVTSTQPKKDPQTLWQELSVVGSYGGNVTNTKATNQNNQPRLITKKIPDTQLVSNSGKVSNSYQQVNSFSPLIASSDFRVEEIKLNQVINGNLASPIIYSEDDEELPPAIITLSEAIVSQQGKEIFPQDSILIAEVHPYSKNGGLLELEVKEIRLPNGEIQSIPTGSMIINRDNGKPLIAELKQEGGDDGGGIDTNTILDGASIVGDFMDIPGARSLHLLRRRGTSYSRNRRNEITSFWYLPENIKVSVRVIKPFSIKTEIQTETEMEEPMELDLEGIDLNSQK